MPQPAPTATTQFARTTRAVELVAALALVASCQLQAGASGSLSGSTTRAGSPSSSSEAPHGRTAASGSPTRSRHGGTLGSALVGMPVAQATELIRSEGFTGELKVVETSEFNAQCAAGTVCGFEPGYWSTDQPFPVRLYTNRQIAITTPE